VNIEAPVAIPAGATRVYVVISGFRELVATYLTVDFGDGSPPLQLSLGEHTPRGDGSLRLEFDHCYAATDNTGTTIRAQVKAAGGLGSAELTMAPESR